MLDALERFFDRISRRWEDESTETTVATLLIFFFLASLGAIFLSKTGLLPESLAPLVPTNYFLAVDAAFTLLLLAEVLGLIFALARSVSISLGKQFEIFSLILLRQSFKELSALGYPFRFEDNLEPLFHILAYGLGALAVFVCLGFYYRLQRHRPTIPCRETVRRFIAWKKLVALLLVVAFFVSGVLAFLTWLEGQSDYSFFERIYSVLIFSDILILLISLKYQPGFHALFRNSGYALSTLIIRLALAAPAYYSVGLGLASALFAIGLTLAYNAFTPRSELSCDEETLES